METLEYVTEDKRFQDQIEEEENEFKRDCAPPKWLENAEYPFKWLMSLRLKTIFLHDFSRKLIREESRNNKPESQDDGASPILDHQDTSADEELMESDCPKLSKFTKSLTVAVMKSVGFHLPAGDGSDPNTRMLIKHEPSNIDDIDQWFAKSKDALSEMEAKGDTFYVRSSQALNHVLEATRAHILFQREDTTESKKIAMNLQPVDEMLIQSQAGIEGIKAKFLMRICRDERKALKASQNAAKLDPEFSVWNFLIGVNIRRLRREYIEDMPSEEVQYFKIAYNLNKNPKYLLFLARAYQESAINHLKRKDYHTSEFYTKKAVELYRECSTFQYDSADFHRRIGNGLSKINIKFTDLTLAKKALLKAFELNPFHELTCQMLGNYYYKHELDDEKALEYFEKAGIRLYSTREIIRLNLIQYSDYDPGDLIEQLIAVASTLREEDDIYCEAGWYYLYFKEDLNMSVKFFWKVLKKHSESFRVMEFKSYSSCVLEPLNVIDVLVNEIKLFKQKNNLLPLVDRKDTTFLESFLKKIFEKHPSLIERTADPNLMINIREKIEKYRDKQRFKRYRCPLNFNNVRSSSWQSTGDASESPRSAAGGCKRWGAVKDSSDFGSQRYMWRRNKQRHGTTGDEGDINKGDGSNYKFDNREGEYRSDSSHDQGSSSGRTRGGGARGQYNRSFKSRYDVTITDWRKK